MDISTKSCELDIISTKLLEQVLHSCIPAIMKIINLSLNKGNSSQEKTLEFSVLQGSTQGAYLFISYASTLDEVVPKDLQHNRYADDHSIWKCFKLNSKMNEPPLQL